MVAAALQGSHRLQVGHELNVRLLRLQEGAPPHLMQGLHVLYNNQGNHCLLSQGTGPWPQE